MRFRAAVASPSIVIADADCLRELLQSRFRTVVTNATRVQQRLISQAKMTTGQPLIIEPRESPSSTTLAAAKASFGSGLSVLGSSGLRP